MQIIHITNAYVTIFSIWKRAEEKATAHGLHMWSFSPSKWKGICDFHWNFTKNQHWGQVRSLLMKIQKTYCHKFRHTPRGQFKKVRRKFPHLTCKLVSCCCWWAMVCFTKTLLMLCSIAYFFAWGARKAYELLTVEQHYLVHISFFPGADLPVAMLPAALGWEAEGQAWSPCSVHSPSSELHLPGIHKHQFNPTVKSKSENGAWSAKAPAWMICRSK